MGIGKIALAQTNTFPSSGNVGIGTISPQTNLHIRKDAYGAQFIISAYGEGDSDNNINVGIRGVIPAAYGPQTSYYSSLNNGYAGDDNSLFVINDKGYNNGAKFANTAIGNGKGSPVVFVDGAAGGVGIGTTNPQGYKLAVAGKVRATEIKVEALPWSDFVFEPSYKLRGLEETEQFIKKNGHIPEIPSAKEVEENGINVGEMNAKLLQKIEELTLYLIDQNKKQEVLVTEVKELKSEINQLKSKP